MREIDCEINISFSVCIIVNEVYLNVSGAD